MFSLCCATAQAQSRSGSAATGDDSKEAVSLDTVRVSSSRIDRPGFDAPTPTTQITAEELAVVSHPNIAAALNELPQFRATTSAQTTGTNTSAGQAPLDLRGLGINRTLVLLDGRRFASDNDLNAIPQILVKSVDVVTGGASAAWGSGAVGGVVNIAMDGDFTGTKFETHFGRSTYSDANERAYGAAFGTDVADGRGHFVAGAEYVNNDGVIPKDSRSTVGGWASFSNGDGTYTMMPDVGFSRAAYGGLIISGTLAGKAFNPDGSLRDFDYGVVRGTAMAGGEAPSVDDYSPLVTPQTRYNVFGRLSYDLGEDVKLTAELRHSRVYDDYVYVGDDNTTGGITIRADNAFLPGAVREAMEAAGETSFTMGRMNTDFALSRMDFERKATQATLALDGVFGNNWRWSAYYSHGETENNLNVSRRLLTTNYANAIDAVIDPATGQAVCRVALAGAGSDCVPINLFGDGAPSEAAAAYVTGTARSR
ncbi:MAG TPA: outer membrane receptor protein, partial [Xanthomonadaceae bacterium]|nr:outer membrane receptor protein [Xanthomonadaceae bacterium]